MNIQHKTLYGVLFLLASASNAATAGKSYTYSYLFCAQAVGLISKLSELDDV